MALDGINGARGVQNSAHGISQNAPNTESKPLLFNYGSSNRSSSAGIESKAKKDVTFNEDGTTTTSIDYDGDGQVDHKVVRDKNGEQKEVIDYSYGFRNFEDGTKIPITKEEHEYWDNGKHTASSRSTIISGKEVDREEFTFTDEGTSKSYTKYKYGELVTRAEYSFYTNADGTEGLEKETRIYDANNELKTIIEYTYPKDENGEIIANVVKETDVKTGKVVTRRYD